MVTIKAERVHKPEDYNLNFYLRKYLNDILYYLPYTNVLREIQSKYSTGSKQQALLSKFICN
jgi:hypothetical protein